MQGAEVSNVAVPSAAQLGGQFDPSTLTGAVDGTSGGICPACRWPRPQAYTAIGLRGYQGEPYSFVGCTSTANCVFPGGVNS